ncbi:hypothetical protein SAMN04489761_4320 [Tenacibaculum sp. MAR_2009_124]|uniref:hypothetical protein n=1 Tax=Tenacibaculum sp. MAR_2009_124 TaxID=1250059 RepID=UPI00089948E8|nr:hypothetical protein [Tenacibaculum sp. MAR_2009_124]SED11491.1 hypothetical protein SAMN04489761_4320 [Tenacibaculum sp. MAR_2009_124]
MTHLENSLSSEKKLNKILEIFAINAIIGIEKNMPVQEVADLNKTSCIMFFNMNEVSAEFLVSKWVEKACELGVMKKTGN